MTGESRKIDLRVVGPTGSVVYNIAKANTASFELTTKEEGPYRFIFSNIKQSSPSDVLTGIHHGSDDDQILASDHLNEMTTTSTRMLKRLNEF